MKELEDINYLVFKNRTFRMMFMNMLLIIADLLVVGYGINTLLSIRHHKSADGVLVILILLFTCLFIVTINTLMINFKTIKMSAQGVEIKFLFFRKFYEWNELKTRKSERFYLYSRIRDTFDEKPSHCIIFSKDIINKSESMSPFKYALMVTPFKSFNLIAISLVDKEKVYPELSANNYNLINKDLFIAKMKKWNIKLERTEKKENQEKLKENNLTKTEIETEKTNKETNQESIKENINKKIKHKAYNFSFLNKFYRMLELISPIYLLTQIFHERNNDLSILTKINGCVVVIFLELIVILTNITYYINYDHFFEFEENGFTLKGPFRKTKYMDYSEYLYVGQYRTGRMIKIIFSKNPLTEEYIKEIRKEREKKAHILQLDCVFINVDTQMKDLPIIDFMKEKFNLEIDLNNTIEF